MHKRAFQALRRMFMHVSGLSPIYLIRKLIYKFFLSKGFGEDLRLA